MLVVVFGGWLQYCSCFVYVFVGVMVVSLGVVVFDVLFSDLDGCVYWFVDYCGYCVLLNFWVSWCGLCLDEMLVLDCVVCVYFQVIVLGIVMDEFVCVCVFFVVYLVNYLVLLGWFDLFSILL